MNSTILETPKPRNDHESESPTLLLKQITGEAVSGRKNSKKWPESLLKREVMGKVRDASEHGHSNSLSGIKLEDKHMADAGNHEPSGSNPQPRVKTEDEDVINPAIAKRLEEDVVDLEDEEVVDSDRGSEYVETSVPLSLKSRVHQKEEPEGSGDASVLEEPEMSSPPGIGVRPAEEHKASHSLLSAARVQPERTPEASDRSPCPQVVSDSSQQTDDDLEHAPVRKRAKIATISHEALIEESQDSLQGEVSVKRRLPAPNGRPVSIDHTSSTLPATSNDTKLGSISVDQFNQKCPSPLVRSKRISTTTDSDLRPHPTNRPLLQSSFNSGGPNLHGKNTVSASPSNSIEPSSSMRSTRSAARDEHSSLSLTDVGIRVCFASSSSAGDSKPFLKFLSSKGVKKVNSVNDCTVLCVGKELKKTGKVILAVLLGKNIITDSWIANSVKANVLLDIESYMARDPKKEADWGISLDEAIDRGKQGLKVLQDYTILFTPSAKKELGKSGFDELKEIVKWAGAKGVSSTLPKKGPETTSTIVVATHDNTEMAELQKLGWKAYAKDIISLSILRGKLDLESDEFLVKEEKKESRKRKR